MVRLPTHLAAGWMTFSEITVTAKPTFAIKDEWGLKRRRDFQFTYIALAKYSF
jgi:hypothetical protein